MALIATLQRSYTCLECDEPFVAPEHSDFVNEDEVQNLWICGNCGSVLATTFNLHTAQTAVLLPTVLAA
jgi:transcription elongation factor Elf1